MAKGFTQEDEALLAKLGVKVESGRAVSRTSREERIIAGFEEIQRFVEQYGCLPAQGEGIDIFERLYAVRLDRIRELQECYELVEPLDHQGLLTGAMQGLSSDTAEPDDDALLAELGIDVEAPPITELKHVRSTTEKKAAEEIANRARCEDFDIFKPIFVAVQKELQNGIRQTLPFKDNAEVRKDDLFILAGQTVYVAEFGEEFISEHGRPDCRLRVIYDNGTESDLLMRSLQRALNKDKAGRRISNPSSGPLFSDQTNEEDLASGTIYVLQSKSDHPVVREHREVIHKIGVTGGSVEKRIANAKLDPTFLMANVKVVATYELYNINRKKLENLFHRIFESARLEIEIMDRFGQPVMPREWFLLPFLVIDEAVEKIKDGTISDYVYDLQGACLKKVA